MRIVALAMTEASVTSCRPPPELGRNTYSTYGVEGAQEMNASLERGGRARAAVMPALAEPGRPVCARSELARSGSLVKAQGREVSSPNAATQYELGCFRAGEDCASSRKEFVIGGDTPNEDVRCAGVATTRDRLIYAARTRNGFPATREQLPGDSAERDRDCPSRTCGAKERTVGTGMTRARCRCPAEAGTGVSLSSWNGRRTSHQAPGSGHAEDQSARDVSASDRAPASSRLLRPNQTSSSESSSDSSSPSSSTSSNSSSSSSVAVSRNSSSSGRFGTSWSPSCLAGLACFWFMVRTPAPLTARRMPLAQRASTAPISHSLPCLTRLKRHSRSSTRVVRLPTRGTYRAVPLQRASARSLLTSI